MLEELKAKATAATIAKKVNALIRNQNTIIAQLRGIKTQEEADALAALLDNQESDE
tara:strand:+ start:95 stop:262 length:168 start_codon:yes stop_codon:yes gene_type:complete